MFIFMVFRHDSEKTMIIIAFFCNSSINSKKKIFINFFSLKKYFFTRQKKLKMMNLY